MSGTLLETVEKHLGAARERIQKSVSGADGAPSTTPDISIPARPSHGAAGKPGVWTVSAPPVPRPPGGLPGVWQLDTTPVGNAPGGAPGTWIFITPMPEYEHGTGDVGQGVNSGDLVHFPGVGDETSTATVTMVRQGHAIAEIAGQVIDLPGDSLVAHNPTGVAPTIPEVVHKGNPVQGSMTDGELALINSALLRYGGGSGGAYDSPDDIQAESVPMICKALDSIAFAAPGMISAVHAVRSKLDGETANKRG